MACQKDLQKQWVAMGYQPTLHASYVWKLKYADDEEDVEHVVPLCCAWSSHGLFEVHPRKAGSKASRILKQVAGACMVFSNAEAHQQHRNKCSCELCGRNSFVLSFAHCMHLAYTARSCCSAALVGSCHLSLHHGPCADDLAASSHFWGDQRAQVSIIRVRKPMNDSPFSLAHMEPWTGQLPGWHTALEVECHLSQQVAHPDQRIHRDNTILGTADDNNIVRKERPQAQAKPGQRLQELLVLARCTPRQNSAAEHAPPHGSAPKARDSAREKLAQMMTGVMAACTPGLALALQAGPVCPDLHAKAAPLHAPPQQPARPCLVKHKILTPLTLEGSSNHTEVDFAAANAGAYANKNTTTKHICAEPSKAVSTRCGPMKQNVQTVAKKVMQETSRAAIGKSSAVPEFQGKQQQNNEAASAARSPGSNKARSARKRTKPPNDKAPASSNIQEGPPRCIEGITATAPAADKAEPPRKRTKPGDLDVANVLEKVASCLMSQQLQQLSVPELKCYLKAKKVACSGNKAALIARVTGIQP